MKIDYLMIILSHVWQILREPWLQRESLWMVLPLIIILIFIHIYFGRYRSEELGWNSAFGNTVSLLWISVILYKFLFDNYTFKELISGGQLGKFIIVTLLTVWVLTLFTFNFFHIIPKKISFIISSAGSVYILAYIVISFIVGNFMFNLEFALSSLIVFLLLLGMIQLIKHVVPMTRSAKQVLQQREKKEKRKKAGRKAAKTRKVKDSEKKKVYEKAVRTRMVKDKEKKKIHLKAGRTRRWHEFVEKLSKKYKFLKSLKK